MSFKEFAAMTDKLKERGKTSNSELVMYLVAPFLNSLGYDTHNLDEVDLDVDEGIITIAGHEDLTTIVTINNDLTEDNDLELRRDDVKLYVNLGIEVRELSLYYKVLEKWEEIARINLDGDEANKYAGEFARRISKEQIKKELVKNGNRFLTESVLNTKLENGEWDNDFLMYGLVEELKNPTDEFIKLMANRLVSDYTTKDVEWVVQKLEKSKEDGYVNTIKRIYNKGYLGGEKEQEEVEIEEEEEPFVPEEIEEEEVETEVTDLDTFVEDKQEDGQEEETEKEEDSEDEQRSVGFGEMLEMGTNESEEEDTEDGEDDNEGKSFQDLLNGM